MGLSSSLAVRLLADLRIKVSGTIVLREEQGVGGGSINDCYRLNTNEGPFFVKVNSADRFPSMFEAEVDGLRRLREAGSIRVPRVIAHGEVDGTAYLLMEHIDDGLKTEAFWRATGNALAALHAHTASHFGLERDNYIGSLPQKNAEHARWDEFFIHCRLEPQVKLARDHRHLGPGELLRFERLYGRLSSLFPEEAPALLHGDLWSGNLLCDAASRPVLIDPAVYHGHREMDIAMTKLFGGFAPAFYSAYHSERPLEKDWEERTDLCNLYPLLVHVNLFGGGYVDQVQVCLRRFV
jgi:fructosamine-3-kinase